VQSIKGKLYGPHRPGGHTPVTIGELRALTAAGRARA